MTEFASTPLVWLATLILHGSAALALVWLLERLSILRAPATREWAWRCAVFGGVLSAGLQLLVLPTPLTGSVSTLLPVAEAPMQVPRVDAPPDLTVRSPGVARSGSQAMDGFLPGAAMSNTVSTSSAAIPELPQISSLAQISLWQWLLAAWLAASVLMLVRVFRSALCLRALLRRSQPVREDAVLRDWQELRIRMQMPVAHLARLDHFASPLALPGRRVLVPAWVLDLPTPQRRAALAHELAHLRRHDPVWRVALAVWRSAFCAIPLLGVAMRRLEAIAELQCDAQAALATGDGRALAECLVLCVERRADVRWGLAAAMASPISPLVHRAELLLEGSSMNVTTPSLPARLAPLFALAASVLLLPALGVTPVIAATAVTKAPAATQAAPAARVASGTATASAASTAKAADQGSVTVIDDDLNDSHISVHISDDLFGERMRFKLRDKSHALDISTKGKITFNDDETDIAKLSDGGSASLEETVGDVTRRLEITAAGGAMKRRYLRDNQEQAIDGDAQQWLARLIPVVLRDTGIDAEGRVGRLYARGGSEAVLAEIGLIHGDHVRASYIAHLVGAHVLSQEEIGRVLSLVGKISSDYELRNALSNLFNKQKLDSTHLSTLLQIAAQLGSDYERAELLVTTARRAAAEPALRTAWLKAAAKIGSDYERRRTLQQLIGENQDPAALPDILAATDGIESDYERREVLSSIAAQVRNSDAIATAYAKAAAAIESDYERREALTALVHVGKLDSAGALAVLDAAAGIASDYECRELLVAIARAMPDDPQVRARYLQVAANLAGYEREQAERAIGGVKG